MAEFASNGKGNLGVTLGAIGTGLGVLSGGLNGILGGNMGAYPVGMVGMPYGGYTYGVGCGCSESQLVNRYEAAQAAKIADLESDVKLRDANIYNDQKALELYKYFDGELKDVRNTLAAQAVMNQKTADSFDMVHQDILCTKNELYSAIHRERDERCCADNAIVNYANATFYPKMVADVTTGTETTAQPTYNPVHCSCGCGCH
jgi:hypothetical protein